MQNQKFVAVALKTINAPGKDALFQKSADLFDLFSDDNFSKIRLIAVKICIENGYDVVKFHNDIDKRVRRNALKI